MDTKKLRQKILDLAIRGKLVPQNPNDEPASVLIEKIRAEKEQLIKEKKIKRDKNESYIYRSDKSYYEKFADGTVKCIDKEIPFEIPESWEWCRLGSVAFYKKGPFGSSITKSMFIPESENAIKVYEQKNAIYKNAEIGSYYISEEKFDELKGFQVYPNDIIVSCAGTIGETYVMPTEIKKGIINQALMRIKLFNNEILDFYLMYFDFVLKSQANEQGRGTAIKNIPPFDILKNFLLPLPPLSEQYRIRDFIQGINEKVDCIDNDKNIVSALIIQTKSKILDLAIRGKLVPQDPNDEPASVLLERIKSEHTESKKKTKSTGDNSHYQNLPFEIPENWVWARFQDIFNIIMGQSPSGEYISSDGEYEFHQGKAHFGDKILLSSQTFTSYPTKLAQSHSLLLCVRAPVGDINITNREVCIGRGLCSLKPLNEISLGFAYYWVSYFKNSFVNKATGTTFLAISSETIRNEFIPIPPLKEQMVITQTINSLYTMLNNITVEL